MAERRDAGERGPEDGARLRERMEAFDRAVERVQALTVEVRVQAEKLARLHEDWAQLYADVRGLRERPARTAEVARNALLTALIAAAVALLYQV